MPPFGTVSLSQTPPEQTTQHHPHGKPSTARKLNMSHGSHPADEYQRIQQMVRLFRSRHFFSTYFSSPFLLPSPPLPFPLARNTILSAAVQLIQRTKRAVRGGNARLFFILISTQSHPSLSLPPTFPSSPSPLPPFPPPCAPRCASADLHPVGESEAGVASVPGPDRHPRRHWEGRAPLQPDHR